MATDNDLERFHFQRTHSGRDIDEQWPDDEYYEGVAEDEYDNAERFLEDR